MMISSSETGKDGTHKHPRIGEAGPSTALPQPLVSDHDNANLQDRERVSEKKGVKAKGIDSQASLTRSLQDMVPLPQLQTFPSVDNAGDLLAFAAMPHFTREFITEYIGGSTSEWGSYPYGWARGRLFRLSSVPDILLSTTP